MLKINFTPEPLLSCQKLYWMKLRGVFEEGEGITFNWNWTGTKFRPLPGAVNGFTVDTSKSYVDKIFTKVYGYSSQAGEGFAVEKPNNTNGYKDCRLTDVRLPGCFYQKLLIDAEEHTEQRIIIMGGRAVYCVYQTKRTSLENLPGKVIAYDFQDGYDDGMVDRFCTEYPLDYGELDIITFEGKDYIIDVNPTPGDAAFGRMSETEREKYLSDYERLLKEWLTSLL